MRAQLRSLGLIVVTLLTASSLVGCGTNKPGGRSSGGASASGFREVKYAVDGGGGIWMQQAAATVTFTEGKVVVEKERVLLNDKEVAKVPEDAKVVEVDYTAGMLTITADGTKVYEAKLGK
jgi:hypothetical protein